MVIMYAIIAAAYGMIVYMSKHSNSLINGNGPLKFEPKKLLRTVIVGAVVGWYAASHGVTSMAGVKNILPIAIPVADQLVKVVWGYVVGKVNAGN